MLPRKNTNPKLQPQTIQPRSGGQVLPAWTPVMPRGGWTPSAAWEAARDYAASLSGRADLPPVARMQKCAYVALLGAFPALHSADVVERLGGFPATGPTTGTTSI
jgi:hypothetical protein